ncbi:MAG: aminotransferase class V-fold PLP-dependent enzyme [Bilophila sp.]
MAVGYASNAIGAINDVKRIAARCREVGALLSVCVHIAPHMAIDMKAIGADFLFCSAYKFFGGHIGIAAIRRHVFDALDTYRLHPAPVSAPGKLETGTQSHEAIASIVPAVEFVAGLGEGATRRERLVSGFERIERHENTLADIVWQGLADVPGLRLYVPKGPKTATVAFTLESGTLATSAANCANATAFSPPMGISTQKRWPSGWASDKGWMDQNRLCALQYGRRGRSARPGHAGDSRLLRNAPFPGAGTTFPGNGGWDVAGLKPPSKVWPPHPSCSHFKCRLKEYRQASPAPRRRSQAGVDRRGDVPETSTGNSGEGRPKGWGAAR